LFLNPKIKYASNKHNNKTLGRNQLSYHNINEKKAKENKVEEKVLIKLIMKLQNLVYLIAQGDFADDWLK
jgi:hypothetical protein